MPIAGCYQMDLYCRNQKDCWDPEHHEGFTIYYPTEFVGQTEGECKRDARANGWTFHRDGEVSCPLCSGKGNHSFSKTKQGDR